MVNCGERDNAMAPLTKQRLNFATNFNNCPTMRKKINITADTLACHTQTKYNEIKYNAIYKRGVNDSTHPKT